MELQTKVNHKKVFSKIGLAVFTSMLLVNIIQGVFFGIIGVVNQELLTAPWISYVGIAISFYLIGFPVFYFMVKNCQKLKKEKVIH